MRERRGVKGIQVPQDHVATKWQNKNSSLHIQTLVLEYLITDLNCLPREKANEKE